MTKASGNNAGASPKTIAVVLVEDDRGFRESLAILLNGTPGFRCAGAFGSAEAVLKEIDQLHVDVVLMDIHLPQMSGIDCVRKIKERAPETRIIMLTGFGERRNIFPALMAGASGYLSKGTPPADLIKAIEEVHRGGAPMSSDIAARVVEYFNRKGSNTSVAVTHLSPREREILDLLAHGFLYKEIAAKLSIAFDTVQWHIRNIYQKLHVRSRSEAISYYLRQPSDND